MKKLIFALLIITAFIGGFLYVLNWEISKTKFIVPESATLVLGQSNEIPAITLIGGAYGGCDSASDLGIIKSQSADQLTVKIEGYDLIVYRGFDGCTTDVRSVEAQIDIDVDWLKTGVKKLVVTLSGKENTYQLAYINYTLKVIPKNVINVISSSSIWPLTLNKPPISLELLLPPPDVAYLRIPYLLSGYPPTKDYRLQLREFAKANGLIPAEQVYPSFPQAEHDRLYVVSLNGTFVDIEGEFPDGAKVFLYK